MEAQPPGGGCDEMETGEQLWWFSAPTVFGSQHKRIMEISASKMALQHLPVGTFKTDSGFFPFQVLDDRLKRIDAYPCRRPARDAASNRSSGSFFEPGSSGRKAPAAMASSVHAPGFPGNFWCRKSAVRISAFSADLVMYLGNPLGVLSVAYHAETEYCSPQFYGSCSITAHVNGGNSAWHRH